jgi:hypothetical protein
VDIHYYNSPSKFRTIGLRTWYIVCPNPECKELIIKAQLLKAAMSVYGQFSFSKEDNPLLTWDLKPQ